MFIFKKIITPFIVAPGIFIILILFTSIWFFIKRNWKAGIINLIIGILMWLVSIPITSNFLLKHLEYNYKSTKNIKGDVIIMLGGGAIDKSPDVTGIGMPSDESLIRIVSTVKLYNLHKMPIILSGGKIYNDQTAESVIFKRFLIDLGIPSNKIIVEDESRDTIENAKYTYEICKRLGYKKPVLVTSAFHMKRSVLSFKKIGMQVIPFPCGYKSVEKNMNYHFTDFLPGNYNYVSIALKEYFGLIYYQIAY